MPKGYSDDFLIKADKTPNSLGARLIGFNGHDGDAVAQMMTDAMEGRLTALWVFDHDLSMFGAGVLKDLARTLELFVYCGTNHNDTSSAAQWALPAAAYLEKDGTFVNCDGRVQRIGRAFAPLGESREDWRLLLDLALRLDRPFPYRNPAEIFLALAEAVPAFSGLNYEEIGEHGEMCHTVAATKAEPQSGEGTGGGGGVPPQIR
jgi:predicted molibdopterin-dependent oxidoreductase YjgC